MTAASTDPLRAHPLADEVVDGGAVHRADGPLVVLHPLLADLLVAGAVVGGRVAVRTASTARLSEPLAAALRDTGGVWLVEAPSGATWDGLSGRVLHPASPFTDGDAGVSEHYSRSVEPEVLQVVLAASVRHRRDTEPRLGVLLESFATELGAPPLRYGPHEPLERAWDRAELTGLLGRLPDAPRLLVEASHEHPLSGSVLVRPTTVGLEEAVEVRVALPGREASTQPALAALERSAVEVFPLFAFALVQPGSADLTRRPFLAPTPAPLAVLIGAPGVRDLGIDPDLLVDRFGAVRIGRQRSPGVLVPFSGRLDAWAAVDELVQLLGSDRVQAAFGRPLPGGFQRSS